MGTSPRLAGSAPTAALILAVLAYRRRLRRRDHWSRAHLLAYQERALARLRSYAYGKSSFTGSSTPASRLRLCHSFRY